MKKNVLSLLLLSFTLFSCNKEPSAITPSMMRLVFTNSSPIVWHLTSYSVDSVNLPLTLAQQSLTKKYLIDSSFITNDGLFGKWKLIVDTLVETYTCFPNGISLSQRYKITFLTSKIISTKYLYNADTITTTYTAGY